MGRMLRFPHLPQFASLALMVAVLAAAWPPAAAAEDTLGSLRAEFRKQTDPVKRAKVFPKLGTALLAEMRKLLHEQEYGPVGSLLLEYRDGASAAFNGLQASGRDADKHPAGYRELEMHLRQSLHVVNDIIFAVPADEREALLAPQRELEQLDQRLVKVLFPNRPEGAKTPPSSSQMHPQR